MKKEKNMPEEVEKDENPVKEEPAEVQQTQENPNEFEYGKLGRYALVTVGIIGLVMFSGFLANCYTKSVGKDFIKSYDETGTSEGGVNKKDDFVCQIIPKEDQVLGAQIKQQRNEIVDRAEKHRGVAVFFFGKFYATVLAFSIAVAIATISLAVITKRGIEDSNNYIIFAFFVASALALFYQGFSGVFQQKNNIEDNQKLYIQYINLKDEIEAYCATGEIVIITDSTLLFNLLAKKMTLRAKIIKKNPKVKNQ